MTIRRPVQITFDNENVAHAVCNDGTMWQLTGSAQWVELPAIPQDESRNEVAAVVGKMKEVEAWANRAALSSNDVRSKLGRYVLDMLRHKPKQPL